MGADASVGSSTGAGGRSAAMGEMRTRAASRRWRPAALAAGPQAARGSLSQRQPARPTAGGERPCVCVCVYVTASLAVIEVSLPWKELREGWASVRSRVVTCG